MNEQRNGFTFAIDEVITLSANEIITPTPPPELLERAIRESRLSMFNYEPMSDGTIRVTLKENEIEKEETKKMEEEAKTTEQEKIEYIEDRYGRKFKKPIAVLQEEIVFEKEQISENEVKEDCYITFHILEQQEKGFDFKYFLTNDNKIFSANESVPDNAIKVLRVISSDYATCYESNTCVEVFLKGRDDFRRESSFSMSIRSYNDIKKIFDILGIEVREDKEGREKMASEDIEKNIDYTFNETPTEEDIDEMISKVNLKTFTDIIRARLIREGHTDKLSELNDKWAKEYLKEWAINKFRFYKMFGRNLRLEKETPMEKEPNEWETIRYSLAEQFPLYHKIFNNISTLALINNDIGTKSSGCISRAYFEDSRVKNHLSFTKFISLFGNNELDIAVSKIYQDKGLGHIYISIDPIDYLTVSVNKSGWRSCHNFFDGEWRNASLSYMIDDVSLVSYRSESENEYMVEGKKFTWNSKRWRQMIYVSNKNSAIVFSRQYPHESEQVSKEIRSLFEECVSNYYNGAHKWRLVSHPTKLNIIVEKDEKATLYNDVGHGFNCTAVFAKDDKDETDQTIMIGRQGKKIFSDTRITDSGECIW